MKTDHTKTCQAHFVSDREDRMVGISGAEIVNPACLGIVSYLGAVEAHRRLFGLGADEVLEQRLCIKGQVFEVAGISVQHLDIWPSSYRHVFLPPMRRWGRPFRGPSGELSRRFPRNHRERSISYARINTSRHSSCSRPREHRRDCHQSLNIRLSRCSSIHQGPGDGSSNRDRCRHPGDPQVATQPGHIGQSKSRSQRWSVPPAASLVGWTKLRLTGL